MLMLSSRRMLGSSASGPPICLQLHLTCPGSCMQIQLFALVVHKAVDSSSTGPYNAAVLQLFRFMQVVRTACWLHLSTAAHRQVSAASQVSSTAVEETKEALAGISAHGFTQADIASGKEWTARVVVMAGMRPM